MVGPFYFALHSWLAGIAGRNKLLINMKAHLQRCPFYFAFIWFRVQGSRFKVQGSGFKVQGSGFKVQGSRFRVEVAASPPFFIGAMPSRFVLAVGFHPCFSSFFIHCCIQ